MQRLVDAQRGLYAYILQLLPNRTDADDVLQAANVVIWSKREQFVEGSEFAAWAARIAYFEVLTYRKHKSRERLYFDDSLVNLLSREADIDAGQIDAILAMLRLCMDKLSEATASWSTCSMPTTCGRANRPACRPLAGGRRSGDAPYPHVAAEVHRRESRSAEEEVR